MTVSGTVSGTVVVNGVATTIYVTEGKSLVIEVVLDKNGNAVVVSVPTPSNDKPAVFKSGQNDENGKNSDSVFNENRSIDQPSLGEIKAPGVPGAPGTPGAPSQPNAPTIPQPPRHEPPASPS